MSCWIASATRYRKNPDVAIADTAWEYRRGYQAVVQKTRTDKHAHHTDHRRPRAVQVPTEQEREPQRQRNGGEARGIGERLEREAESVDRIRTPGHRRDLQRAGHTEEERSPRQRRPHGHVIANQARRRALKVPGESGGRACRFEVQAVESLVVVLEVEVAVEHDGAGIDVVVHGVAPHQARAHAPHEDTGKMDDGHQQRHDDDRLAGVCREQAHRFVFGHGP